jgi:hypothetical protein
LFKPQINTLFSIYNIKYIQYSKQRNNVREYLYSDKYLCQFTHERKIDNFPEHFQPTDELYDALTDIAFSNEDIEKASPQPSPGPDGVPAVLLKTCIKQLSHPLNKLWRGSMDCGTIPAETLLVIICPIHNGGSRSLPNHYRPVALTSHLIKIFERVLRTALVSHIEQGNLLPGGQHGHVQGGLH